MSAPEMEPGRASPPVGEFDLKQPAFASDPYPLYDRLRAEAPVHWLEHGGVTGGMWLVSRYQDVDVLLRDPRIGKDITRVHADLSPAERGLPMMLMSDPPDHTRLRSLVGAAFTPKVVRDLAPRIEGIVARLLDDANGRGSFDLVADFALPMPVIVIAEMLGVPVEDREDFQAWSNAFIEGTDVANATPEVRQRSMEAQQALAGYFMELIEQRRSDPRDDLITALVAASDGEDRLTIEELIGTCVLLLVAGHETTANLIGNGVLAFMRNRNQWQRLVADPDLAAGAVEEILRYESPVQRATFRIALERVEFQGVSIERGQQVSAVIGAANRDPDAFQDPDAFDIGRTPNRHLAFGKGIHFCLGAPLARLEGRIAFRELARRMPNLELADPEAEPKWRPTTVFRGVQELPVKPRA